MRQCARLGNCRVAPCQRLVGEAETKKYVPQERLCVILRMDYGVIRKPAVGIRIVKRKDLFQMRSG